MNAIEVDDLRKAYRSSTGELVHALAGISFNVAPGQIYGFLGPNGAGKSTLVRILTTITTPSAGRASVHGFDVVRNPLDVRRHIAVVLQQTAVETMLTVRDNLLIYAYLHGIDRGEAQKRMRSVLAEFDLEAKASETVQDLSIGTKRRVQVAKLFMIDAPIVFLDESTTGMDPLMKRRVLDRIRAEANKGRTVLLTTQVLSEAEQLCDTIMIIDHGRLLFDGGLKELKRQFWRDVALRIDLKDLDEAQRLGQLELHGVVKEKVDDLSYRLRFPREELSAADVIRRVVNAVEVRDIVIEEQAIDEVVKRIYLGEVFQESRQ
jgi:ABC-type multidrug transport system ATPase subunit